MVLPQDLLSKSYTKPKVILCQTNKENICQLDATELSGTFKFNSYSEISFNVASVYQDLITGETKPTPYYDYIEGLRLVYLEGFGYFQLQNPELYSDGIKEYKSINAYSLEYVLSQRYLENFIINKGDVGDTIGSIDGIVLYNPNDSTHSLLHLVLQKAYGWTIGHVDDELANQSRSFEVDRESIYDFLMNEMCETFKCYIEFDTINNTVNVYSENEIERFIGDGVKASFQLTKGISDTSEVTINGHVISQYSYDSETKIISFITAPSSGDIIEVTDNFKSKYDTDVFVTFENLSNEMKVNYSADDIKTVLTVKGADDLDIRNVNFGLPSIMNLDYYHTTEWMGQKLYDAYSTFVDKQDKYMTGFYDIDRTGTLEESFSIVSSKDEFIAGEELTLPVISSTETFNVSSYSYKESFVVDGFVKEFVAEENEQTFNEPEIIEETIVCKDPTIEQISVTSSTQDFTVNKTGDTFKLSQDFEFNDKTIVKISDRTTERVLDKNEYSYDVESHTITYNGTVPAFSTITLILINYTNKYKINSIIGEMSEIKVDNILLQNEQYSYDAKTEILTINIDLSGANYIYVYTYINTFVPKNSITSNSVIEIDGVEITRGVDYEYLNNKLVVYSKLTSDNSIVISTPQGKIQTRFNLSNSNYSVVYVKINGVLVTSNKYSIYNGAVDLSKINLTYGDIITIKSVNNKIILTDVKDEIISVQINNSDVEYNISGNTLTIDANKFIDSNIVKVTSINNKFVVSQTRKTIVYVKVDNQEIYKYIFNDNEKTLSINTGILSPGNTITILFMDNDFTLHDAKEKILSVKINGETLSSKSFSYQNDILTISVNSLSEDCNVEIVSVDNSFNVSSLSGNICGVLIENAPITQNDFSNSNGTLIIEKYDLLKVGGSVTVRALYNQFKLSNTKNKILEVLIDDIETIDYVFNKSQNLITIKDTRLEFGSTIIVKSFDNYFTVTNNFGDKYIVEKISGEQKETLSKNEEYTYQNNILTIEADVEDGDNVIIRRIESPDSLLVVAANAGDKEILLQNVIPTLNSYEPKVGDYIIYVPGYSQRLEELYKLIDEELELQNSVPNGYEDNYEEIKIKQVDNIFEHLQDADVSKLGYVRKIVTIDDRNQEVSSTHYICQMKFSIASNGDKSYIYEWVERDIKFGDKGIYLIQEDIDIYTSISQVQIDAGWSSDTSNSNYKYYEDNLIKLNNAKKALGVQNEKIKEKRNEINQVTEVIHNLSEIIDVKNNFSYNDLERLSLLLREDEYSDDCFVVTELDTDKDKINVQKELLVAGYKELKRISKPKLSFSASMKNIYAMPEFSPILRQFKLGNFVRVAIRKDYIKKVRLLEVQIDFDDLSNLSCSFGDLIAVKDEADIHAELLQQAISAGKSVASTSSYWQKGADIATSIDDKIRRGLIDATTSIKSNSSGQDVSWDTYGIHMRKIVDGVLDRHEGWITNNQFLYSDDNFETTKSVFGEYTVDGETYYGLLAEAVIAGLVEGSKIIGGTIKIGPTDEKGVAAFQVNSDGTVYMSKNDELNKLSYFSFDPNNGLIIASNGADDGNSKFFSRLSPDKIEFGITATFNITTSEPTKSNFGNRDYCIWEKTEGNSTRYTYYQNKLNPQPINGFIDLKERDKNDKTILGHIITYFSKDGTHMKQAEVEGSLRVGTNSSIEKNPYISLGSFRLQVEQNGSLSIIAM